MSERMSEERLQEIDDAINMPMSIRLRGPSPAEVELLAECKALREELIEKLQEAFYQIATLYPINGRWWDNGALTTTLHLGDRLVELGVFEKRPGVGRRQFYRPIEKPEPNQGDLFETKVEFKDQSED